jgi:hypothetical protein
MMSPIPQRDIGRKSESPIAAGFTYGVVTFLDVMGWKGIYNREKDPISALSQLVDGLTVTCSTTMRGRLELDVKSISDTVVIISPISDTKTDDAIEAHGELCAMAIAQSIISRIPVRGATAVGEYAVKDNIYVGKAIDEAAAWHEAGDWIGVHLTPSAFFSVGDKQKNWILYTPPLKRGGKHEVLCVNWLDALQRSIKDKAPLAELKSLFLRMGPIDPEIADKFYNTLGFVEHMIALAEGLERKVIATPGKAETR